MDNVGTVDGLQGAQRLIDEVLRGMLGQQNGTIRKSPNLTMVVRQVLCSDNAVQICLHQLLDDWNELDDGR